ncbi:2-oxoisovalerate dehydrogenase [Spirosoma sp. SC4-14]|uniref:type II toxin-antitoxin system HicB family antitoxin n=1 Tax=Spirosoma sp. SC4-14 TaxID=3128900 RepID=UPI0030CC023A
MKEIFFLIEEAEEGGYIASAIGESIITEADTLDELKANIKEATICHFEEGQAPKVAHLHFVKDEVLSLL